MTISQANVTETYPNQRRAGMGYQHILDLNNGFKLSILKTPFSYGSNEGLFEIGLIRNGELVHHAPWDDQVKGFLSDADVFDWIERLKEYTSHLK